MHTFLQLSQSSNGRATLAPPPSKPFGGQGGQLGAPCPDKLLMQLVAAPSTFSVPLCTGKLLNPPFRVSQCVDVPLHRMACKLLFVQSWHAAWHALSVVSCAVHMLALFFDSTTKAAGYCCLCVTCERASHSSLPTCFYNPFMHPKEPC